MDKSILMKMKEGVEVEKTECEKKEYETLSQKHCRYRTQRVDLEELENAYIG